MEGLKCTSCGMNVLAKKNFVKLMCPKCGKFEVTRCSTCKSLGTKYECKSCGFIGP